MNAIIFLGSTLVLRLGAAAPLEALPGQSPAFTIVNSPLPEMTRPQMILPASITGPAGNCVEGGQCVTQQPGVYSPAAPPTAPVSASGGQGLVAGATSGHILPTFTEPGLSLVPQSVGTGNVGGSPAAGAPSAFNELTLGGSSTVSGKRRACKPKSQALPAASQAPGAASQVSDAASQASGPASGQGNSPGAPQVSTPPVQTPQKPYQPPPAPQKPHKPNTTPAGNMLSGKARYYDPDAYSGRGSCGNKINKNQLICALHTSVYSSKHCSRKIEITYNGKVGHCIVEDLCPGCGQNGLDLSHAAFKQFDPSMKAGVLNVQWRFLDNTRYTSDGQVKG